MIHCSSISPKYVHYPSLLADLKLILSFDRVIAGAAVGRVLGCRSNLQGMLFSSFLSHRSLIWTCSWLQLSPAGNTICSPLVDLKLADLPLTTDMCELARNSCLQSGFEMEVKRHWLGHDWYKPGVEGNLIHKTNVPSLRVKYRHTTLMEEIDMVRSPFPS